MSDAFWSTHRRETGLIEHICYHGIGHPNAGSIQYMEYNSEHPWRDRPIDIELLIDTIPTTPYEGSSWGVHGCDGCCGRSDWPGVASGSIKHVLLQYVENNREDLIRDLKQHHYALWWALLAAVDEAKDLER